MVSLISKLRFRVSSSLLAAKTAQPSWYGLEFWGQYTVPPFHSSLGCAHTGHSHAGHIYAGLLVQGIPTQRQAKSRRKAQEPCFIDTDKLQTVKEQ